MKKRIVIVALLVCILVLSIASTTIAYFTDTKAATNTFTVGDVEITLSEADPTNNNALTVVDGTNLTGFTYENVYPTQTIVKTPTITNVATDDAYVGAVITITVAENAAIKDILADEAAVKAFLGGIATDDIVFTDARTATVKIIKTDVLVAGDANAYVVFENVVIPATWDNEDMAIFAGLTIKVDAYATQVAGMADLATAAQRDDVAAFAMESAFPGVFN